MFSSAKTIKNDNKTIAVEFIVIEIETLSKGMSLNKILISSIVHIGTPTFPISPADNSWSESYPVCVGRSNATDKPV